MNARILARCAEVYCSLSKDRKDEWAEQMSSQCTKEEWDALLLAVSATMRRR